MIAAAGRILGRADHPHIVLAEVRTWLSEALGKRRDRQAVEVASQAVRDARVAGDPYWLGRAQGALGRAHLLTMGWTDAELFLQEAAKAAVTLQGLAHLEPTFRYNLGLALIRQQRRQEGLNEMRRAAHLCRQLGLETEAGWAKMNTARIHTLYGELTMAQELLQEAETLIPEGHPFHIYRRAVMAWTLAKGGHLTKAQRHLRWLREQSGADAEDRAVAALACGWIYFRAGDKDKAVAAVEVARTEALQAADADTLRACEQLQAVMQRGEAM